MQHYFARVDNAEPYSGEFNFSRIRSSLPYDGRCSKRNLSTVLDRPLGLQEVQAPIISR
jgi:hypothetical protein